MTARLREVRHRAMTLRTALRGIAANEDLNFLLTNRIPRRLATRLGGWISRIEQPWIRDLSIWTWRQFTDLDLSDAATTRFASLHACFTRELRPGARPIHPDPDTLVSPCDAIVGAHGAVAGTRLFQVKGLDYELDNLIGDTTLAEAFRDGTYVTLRLTSAMYHRFHAPFACRVASVRYIWGDTWNANPIALKRVEALYCRNERAALRLRLEGSGALILLVPVAAILVAGLRLRFLDADLRAGGTRTLPCDAALDKGEEMGWFEHGSTIVVLAPLGFALCEGLAEGHRIRVGEPLMRLPPAPSPRPDSTAGRLAANPPPASATVLRRLGAGQGTHPWPRFGAHARCRGHYLSPANGPFARRPTGSAVARDLVQIGHADFQSSL